MGCKLRWDGNQKLSDVMINFNFLEFSSFSNSDPPGQFELTTDSLTIKHLNKHGNTTDTQFKDFCVFARRHFTYN